MDPNASTFTPRSELTPIPSDSDSKVIEAKKLAQTQAEAAPETETPMTEEPATQTLAPKVTDVVGMDLSKDLGDFKKNVIALMSTVTGVATKSDVKSTFNAKTKQYYAVKLEGLASGDVDTLNTNASSNFADVLSGNVDKISSKSGKVISVSDDEGKKTNANISRYIRQSIFPDGTVGPDRNILKNMEGDISKLTGISGFKFANVNVGATQIFFGYEKNADGTVSGQGRVQYVASQAKQGSIIPGSFKIENNNIVLSKDLGMQNKTILEKLLGVSLTNEDASKEPVTAAAEDEEQIKEFTPEADTSNLNVEETGDLPEVTGNLEQQEVIAGGKKKTKKRRRKSVRFNLKKRKSSKTAKKHRKTHKKK